MVLESVFSRITRDVLLLDDMAADETLQVVYQSSSLGSVTFTCMCRSYLILYSNVPASKTDSSDVGKSIIIV